MSKFLLIMCGVMVAAMLIYFSVGSSALPFSSAQDRQAEVDELGAFITELLTKETEVSR